MAIQDPISRPLRCPDRPRSGFPFGNAVWYAQFARPEWTKRSVQTAWHARQVMGGRRRRLSARLTAGRAIDPQQQGIRSAAPLARAESPSAGVAGDRFADGRVWRISRKWSKGANYSPFLDRYVGAGRSTTRCGDIPLVPEPTSRGGYRYVRVDGSYPPAPEGWRHAGELLRPPEDDGGATCATGQCSDTAPDTSVRDRGFAGPAYRLPCEEDARGYTHRSKNGQLYARFVQGAIDRPARADGAAGAANGSTQGVDGLFRPRPGAQTVTAAVAPVGPLMALPATLSGLCDWPGYRIYGRSDACKMALYCDRYPTNLPDPMTYQELAAVFLNPWCSGTMISATHVLTAAHCVHGRTPDGGLGDLLKRVDVALEGNDYARRYCWGRDCTQVDVTLNGGHVDVSHPTFEDVGFGPAYDVAVVALPERWAVPHETFCIRSRGILPGERLQNIGYPKYDNNCAEVSRVARDPRMSAAMPTYQQGTVRSIVSDRVFDSGDVSMIGGLSGSAAFAEEMRLSYVMGVFHGMGSSWGTAVQFTSVPAHHAWIRSVTGIGGDCG